MARKQYKTSIPWGSQMVCGVEIRCRIKNHIVPDLSEIVVPVNVSNYEYDFFLEKQVIADHDEYLRLKRSAENSSPKNTSNVSAYISKPSQLFAKPVAEQGIRIISPATYKLASSNLSGSTVENQSVPSACQLVCGQVLKPSKTEILRFQENTNEIRPVNGITDEISSSPSNQTLNNKLGVFNSANYLRDFDIEPDDPFASAELKTINELEELKKVLMYQNPCNPCISKTQKLDGFSNSQDQSFNPTTSICLPSVRCSENLIDGNANLECSRNLQSIHFKNPVSTRPFNTPLGSKFPHCDSVHRPCLNRTSCRSVVEFEETTFHQGHPKGSFVLSKKPIYSSSPNLHQPSPCVSKHSNDLKDPSLVKELHIDDLQGNRSVPQTFFTNIPSNNHPSYSHATFESLLLSWAKNNGFSIRRARRLIEINRGGSAFTYRNLELDKLTLFNQLHSVDLLLSSHMMAQNGGCITEESALLIIATYPDNLSKAQLLAIQVLEMEKNGCSPELIPLFIRNSRICGSNSTIKAQNYSLSPHAVGTFVPSSTITPSAPAAQTKNQ